MTRRSSVPRPTRESCPRCGEVHERCTGHVDDEAGLRPCRRWPLRGAEVCTSHGAAAPQVRKAAGRRVVRDAALAEAARLGGSLDIDPLDALLGQVREAAANVEVLRAAIADLGVDVAREGAIAIPEQVIEFEKGGTHVPAKVHVLVSLYSEERDRLVKYAKLCLDAGVDERRVTVAEQDAARLGRAFAGALDDVAELLSPEAREGLRAALGTRLRALVAM